MSTKNYYRMDGVFPKDGDLRDVHLAVTGKKCWIDELVIGQRATIQCEVHRGTANFKPLHTSAVLSAKEEDDGIINVETLNTIYVLRPINE